MMATIPHTSSDRKVNKNDRRRSDYVQVKLDDIHRYYYRIYKHTIEE